MNKLSDIEKEVLVEEAKSAGLLFFDKDKDRLWTPESKIKDFLCFVEDFSEKTLNNKGRLLEFKSYTRVYLAEHQPGRSASFCIKRYKTSALFKQLFDSNLCMAFDHQAGHYLVLAKDNQRYWIKEYFFKV